MRPGTTASAQPPAAVVMGIDLGGTKTHGALAEENGAILAERVYPTTADGAYETVVRCVVALRAEAAALGRKIAAVGLGVPAVVQPRTGVVTGGPNVGWDGFALGDRLAADLDLPIVVENDADLAAVGEARRGAGRAVSDFVVVSVGTGVGAAVVAGGRLVKGRHNAAGELGCVVLDRPRFGQLSRGGPGTFEYSAAGPGLVRRAAMLLAGDGQAATASELASASLTAAAVFDAAGRGDPVASATVAGLVDDMAVVLIALIATLDPGLVILDGSVGRALRPYLDDLHARVGRHVGSVPAIRVSSLTPTATLVGALVAAEEMAARGGTASQFGTLAASMELAADPLVEPVR